MAGKFFMSLINEDFTMALYVSRAARRSGLSSPLTFYAPKLLHACFVFPCLVPQIHFSVRKHCFIFSSQVWWLQYRLFKVFFFFSSLPVLLGPILGSGSASQVFVLPSQTTSTAVVEK